MLVEDSQAMQHKLTDTWTNAYNSEYPAMDEDSLEHSPPAALAKAGLENFANGLIKREVITPGGLEQKIQELRAEKEAAEFKKRPGSVEAEQERRLHQDSPIDFSVKRRSSFSGSLTDDSMASSVSPSHVTDYGNAGSPGSEQTRNGVERFREHRDVDQPYMNGGGDYHKRSSPSPDGSLEDVKFVPGKMNPLLGGGGGGPNASPLLNGLGMFPGLPANLLANGSAINAFSQLAASAALMDPRGNNKKANRPFKAYPKEALQMPLGFMGLPGMSPALLQQGLEGGLFGGANGEDIMSMYNQQLQLLREKQIAASGQQGKVSPPTVQKNHNNHNHNNHQQQPHPSLPQHPPHPQNQHRVPSPNSYHSHDEGKNSPKSTNNHNLHPASPSSFSVPSPLHNGTPTHHSNSTSSSSTSHVSSTSPSFSNSNSRKRPRTFPDDQKDAAYWERRRKNNDAAKRSRDARRAKEDEIAIRAALLEQENLKLRVEVAALKTETARLRCLLYNS